MITWDDKKCHINQKRHDIDFAECELIFDNFTISREDSREAYGEIRICSLGL